jgi:hypothetical protein
MASDFTVARQFSQKEQLSVFLLTAQTPRYCDILLRKQLLLAVDPPGSPLQDRRRVPETAGRGSRSWSSGCPARGWKTTPCRISGERSGWSLENEIQIKIDPDCPGGVA